MPKFINEIGNIYNNLKVIDRAENKNKRAQWVCECIHCKQKYVFTGTALRAGTLFCSNCELIGQKFGKFEVIKYSHTASDRHKHWICKCECGNIEVVSATHLRTGKRTCCLNCSKNNFKRQYINEVGNSYGNLTVLEIDVEKSGKNAFWICKCKCGNLVSVQGTKLREGHTSSCGCLKSKGEEKISKILLENNILFKQQIIFEDCKDKNFLKFDFGIYQNDELKYLIEYDGIQHFKSTYGWNTEESLAETTRRDQIKNKYCKDNNIPLIRIPYYHFNNLIIDDLKIETSKFLY